MEHLGLCEESHMVRAAKLNLALSFFVAHLYFYGDVYKESILGEERTNRWAPLSLVAKHGLFWTIHQDHPAFPGPPQPFANMKVAVTRTRRGVPDVVYGKEYCISIEEALKAYTINAAWQLHKEKELGSLTVGKRADLVILSDNPLNVDAFNLEDIKVIDTFLDGCSNGISEKSEAKVEGRIVVSYSC
jgi:predicted amidohydrolase YtcJ